MDVALAIRVGIASGPVMAGVIGAARLSYDVWGDTVNLAPGLKTRARWGAYSSAGRPGRGWMGTSKLEARGALDIRGLGAEETWYLGVPLPVPGRAAMHEPADATALAEHRVIP